MGPQFARACAVVAVVVSLGACGKKETPSGAGSGEGKSAPAAGGLGLAFLNGFEGEIGLLFKDSGKGSKPVPPLALMIKDNKLRIELPPDFAASNGMGKGYAVVNTPEKKLYAVLEDKKQVVLVDLDKAGEQL